MPRQSTFKAERIVSHRSTRKLAKDLPVVLPINYFVDIGLKRIEPPATSEGHPGPTITSLFSRPSNLIWAHFPILTNEPGIVARLQTDLRIGNLCFVRTPCDVSV